MSQSALNYATVKYKGTDLVVLEEGRPGLLRIWKQSLRNFFMQDESMWALVEGRLLLRMRASGRLRAAREQGGGPGRDRVDPG